MVQQVATTKLDIAAPSGVLLDADVKVNDGGGDAFSLQLADAQAGNDASAIRNDTVSVPEVRDPVSVQAPQEDDVLITDENIANEISGEQVEQDVDEGLLQFLQRLNQNSTGYDPTDTSGKKQDGGVLQNLNGNNGDESSEESLSDNLSRQEETLVNIANSAEVEVLAPINVNQSVSEDDLVEADVQFSNLSVEAELVSSESDQAGEKLVEFSSLTQPNVNQREEDDSGEQLNEAEEVIDVAQLDSLTLHQPLVESLPTQNTDDKLSSVPSVSSDNNVPEQQVEGVDTPINVAVVQSLLQSSPEQQENAFNQISAIAGLNTAEKASKDFVAALKAGFEDIKAKYQAGQDVSHDLTQLVDQVAQNLQESGQLSEQQFNQITQAAGLFSQGSTGQGEGVFQSLLARTENRLGTASSGIEQLEANKVAQQNSAFEKAVNLAKPEAAVQLAEKVAFAVNARNLVADIRLDPADLGGIQARVSLQGDQASVNFVTQSQQARDLLEQQTPKLRELLDEQGIELGQSSVQQESQQTQDGENRGAFANSNVNGQAIGTHSTDNEESLQEIAESSITNGHVGAIDYFV